MPKLLEGFIDDGHGAPLAGIPAVVTTLAGVPVTSGVTDSAGRWAFPGLAETSEYFVTLTDPLGNAVARAPWSGEMRELWVRDLLTSTGPISVLYSGVPRISNFKAAGSLQRPALDFERWKTTVGVIEEVAVGSTIGTLGFNASGATNLAYGGSIYAYVDAPIVGGTAPIAFSFYHATLGETYRLDSQGRGWFAPPDDTSLFPATPGLYISGKWVGVSATADNGLTWNSDGFYSAAGLTQAAADLRYVNLDGDTMTGLLFVDNTVVATDGFVAQGVNGHVVLGKGDAPNTPFIDFRSSLTGTFDVRIIAAGGDDTEGHGGLNIIAGFTDLNSPFRVQGKMVAASPAPDNTLVWGGDGFYVPPSAGGGGLDQAAADTRYVNTAGDTMTGDLNMTANVLPTATNTRDLGTSALRWKKIWAVDADFTNAPTVGGAALLTSTTADALFLTPAEGNAAYVGLAGGSVMTGLLGPTTTNTRDLGTSALRWRNAYLATSLNIGTTPAATGVVRLANASLMAWRNASNTGDLTLGVNAADALATSAHIVPTVTNTLDLGTASLLWRKMYATDAAFTNTPTIGASMAMTLASSDASYLKLTGGTLSGALAISTGDLTLTAGRLNIMQANAGLEFGAQGTANTPFFDFHSGAINTDWDVRLIANGGTGVNSGGTLQILAAALAVSNNQTIGGTLGVTGATTMSSLSVNSRPVIMAGVRVYHNANQAITASTPTILAFNSERFDTDNFHDNATNNSRLTVPAGMGGSYTITACINWAAVADSTYREVGFRVNGATFIAFDTRLNVNSAALAAVQNLSTTYQLAAGDYVEVRVQQMSVGSLNVVVAGNYTPEFTMQRTG